MDDKALFIINTLQLCPTDSTALNASALYGQVDLICISWKKIFLKVIPMILFLCVVIVITVVTDRQM